MHPTGWPNRRNRQVEALAGIETVHMIRNEQFVNENCSPIQIGANLVE